MADIPVRDGMQVRSGDLLLRLDETQARANAQVLTQQLNQIRVRLARLTAERDGLDQPQMSRDLVDRSIDQEVDPACGRRRLRCSIAVRRRAAPPKSCCTAMSDSLGSRLRVWRLRQDQKRSSMI